MSSNWSSEIGRIAGIAAMAFFALLTAAQAWRYLPHGAGPERCAAAMAAAEEREAREGWAGKATGRSA